MLTRNQHIDILNVFDRVIADRQTLAAYNRIWFEFTEITDTSSKVAGVSIK